MSGPIQPRRKIDCQEHGRRQEVIYVCTHINAAGDVASIDGDSYCCSIPRVPSYPNGDGRALLGLADEVGPGYKLIVSDGWRWVKEGA